ncbi:HutD/Ves family protein [Acerihabitans arboris]|uniref:HutD family protein n=1 Tax=Acerihabitans arboris TaxID=2691583 RepID=A0A845SDV9_9GAMM|nr:HutD family protein [Acerihabitans arboris]NDL62980.1 HutD family protein [Acerihabitans arboris]
MNRPVRFSFDTLPVSRWRNGGGETREIISWPGPDAAADARVPAEPAVAFAWRASIATIDRDGAFSSFPGVDRIIALLEGDGVTLHNASGQSHDLTRPGAPHAFAGEEAISAALAGASSRDFNIMTRRRDWRARVERLTGEHLLPAGRDGVIYILSGRWQMDDGTPLAAREGAWWHQLGAPARLWPAGGGVALWADIAQR